MGLFRRKPRSGRHGARRETWGERRAAERTERAEANLLQTEQWIHDLADETRRDLKGSTRR